MVTRQRESILDYIEFGGEEPKLETWSRDHLYVPYKIPRKCSIINLG
jgi:hypothetical protein